MSENSGDGSGENETIPSMAEPMVAGTILRASTIVSCSPVIRSMQTLYKIGLSGEKVS